MLSALPPVRRRLLLGILAVLVAGVLVAVIAGRGEPDRAVDRGRAGARRTSRGRCCWCPGTAGRPRRWTCWPRGCGRPAGRRRSSGCPATAPASCATRPRCWTGRPGRRSPAGRRRWTWSATPPAGWWPGCGPRRTAAPAIARRIVTLGAPHHGTDLAALAGSLLPGQCPTACAELAPNSDLLTRLNARDDAGRPGLGLGLDRAGPDRHPARLGPPRRRPQHPGPVRLRRRATGPQQPAPRPAWSSPSSSPPWPPPARPPHTRRLPRLPRLKPSGEGERRAESAASACALSRVMSATGSPAASSIASVRATARWIASRVAQWMRCAPAGGPAGRRPPGVERQDGERTLAVHVEAVEQHPRASQPAARLGSGHRAGEFDPGQDARHDRHVPVEQRWRSWAWCGLVGHDTHGTSALGAARNLESRVSRTAQAVRT